MENPERPRIPVRLVLLLIAATILAVDAVLSPERRYFSAAFALLGFFGAWMQWRARGRAS